MKWTQDPAQLGPGLQEVELWPLLLRSPPLPRLIAPVPAQVAFAPSLYAL